MRWRTEHTTLAALLVALALPVFCVWAAYHAAGDLAGARGIVGRSQRVVGDTQTVQLQVSQAEAEARAYLLHPESSRRTGFAAARTSVEQSMGALSQFVAGDPEQKTAVAQLRAACDRRLDQMDREMNARAAGNMREAIDLADSQETLDGFAATRQAAAAVQAGEQHEMAQRRTVALAFQRRWTNLFWAACIASLGLILGCFLALAREVRRRRRTQDQLSESSKRYNGLIANIPSAVWSLGEKGVVAFISGQVFDITGYRDAVVLGSAPDFWLEKIPSEDRERVATHFAALFRDGAPLNLELQLRHAGGAWRWVHLQSNHVTGQPGERIANGVATDITARKELDAAERQRHEAEIHGREMELANRAKSEFLALVSHELRTPLSAVLGFSGLLQERVGGALTDEQADFVGHINSSGQYLLDLVNNILDLASIEAGKLPFSPVAFELRDAVQGAMQTVLAGANRKQIQLQAAIGDGIAVHGDPLRVRQILLNLLGNAVKFTPDGGLISVRASTDGNRAVLCVADTGIGIAAENREAIFESFRQVATPGPATNEGAGLGLAIARQLVAMHGGRIWVEDAGGGGSQFLFTLPLAAAAASVA